MMRRNRNLLVIEQFLVKFLPVTQTAIHYLHVHGATQLDHTLCQVSNAHGISHVKDEDFAALAHRTRFKHQLTGLGNKHEITDNVGMCNRNRSTRLYLTSENRNDRTIRTQHVAKTCSNKLCDTLYLSSLDGTIEALHIDFTNTLGATHHVGRIDSLVR
ncbi:hypothetical protein EVA_22504 [gut metagenome]|uniref:Uncharacterized protein n=1 Tax=gut metagenome TaxID=749906 RepID=J9F3C0_9ZZZZ